MEKQLAEDLITQWIIFSGNNTISDKDLDLLVELLVEENNKIVIKKEPRQ